MTDYRDIEPPIKKLFHIPQFYFGSVPDPKSPYIFRQRLP